jgi:hypothetical protein
MKISSSLFSGLSFIDRVRGGLGFSNIDLGWLVARQSTARTRIGQSHPAQIGTVQAPVWPWLSLQPTRSNISAPYGVGWRNPRALGA